MQDDLLISAALCAVLDEKAWGRAESFVVSYDPLEGLGKVF